MKHQQEYNNSVKAIVNKEKKTIAKNGSILWLGVESQAHLINSCVVQNELIWDNKVKNNARNANALDEEIQSKSLYSVCWLLCALNS